jgi:peptidoglycan/xylan/chitin deacetylase (PgdA/CDA1 family)
MTIRLTLDFEDLSTSLFEPSDYVYSGHCALRVANEFSKLGNKLCVFVVTSTLTHDIYKEALSILIKAGCDIGSHTHSHMKMNTLEYQDQHYELEKSKDILESFANRTIEKFRAPGFFYNQDTLRALENVKFKENWSVTERNKSTNKGVNSEALRGVMVPTLMGVPVGGGYLRCTSVVSTQLFKALVQNNVSYVHPWEFYNFNNIVNESEYPKKFKIGSGEKYLKLWNDVTDTLL